MEMESGARFLAFSILVSFSNMFIVIDSVISLEMHSKFYEYTDIMENPLLSYDETLANTFCYIATS